MFVFRTNTIERFFPASYQFSGYDDISVVPQNTDGYIWWYQLPVEFDSQLLAEIAISYVKKLKYVLSQISSTKYVYAFTMNQPFYVPVSDSDHTVASAVGAYNEELWDLAKNYHNLKVVDVSEFTKDYDIDELFDWKYYFISQMGMNPKLSVAFQQWWNAKLESVALKRKKCLVLDLDNTLWGGVLGEDGIDGIKIGGDYPGKAFLYWQKALLQLSKTGIILCVCSKNNENDVIAAWEQNPFIILKKEHFAAYRINWRDKASNLKELAQELNIGLDSMVFVDDNPTERELIRQSLPMVAIPDFPSQPYDLMKFYRKLSFTYFRAYSLTDEDLKKAEQYKSNALRKQAETQFTDMKSFLQSLEIELKIEAANHLTIPRISQMTQKTNQFNLTTHRYSESDIETLILRGAKIWTLSVKDKFGDSGITGLIIVIDDKIDTLLLSCRILGKGIEKAFVKYVLKQFSGTIYASYFPTDKNDQVRCFYDSLGFVCVSQSEGVKEYKVRIEDMDLTIDDYYKIV